MKSKYFSVPYGNVGLTAFKNQAGLMAALVSATSQNKSLENAVKQSTGNMTKVQKKAGNVASPAELRQALMADAQGELTSKAIQFALSNPSLEIIQKKYEFKSISDLKTIRNGLKGAIQTATKEMKDLIKQQKLSNKDKVNRESVIALLGNLEGILAEIIRVKEYEAESKAADEKAVARGLKDAEDAIAIREVEIEWYYKLYGVQDPIKILAYQKIEKDKYGMTSYEAALQGKQLIEPASPEVQTNREAADAEAEQIASDIVAAEQAQKDKQKAMLIYSAVGIGILGGVVYFFGRNR